MVSGKGWLLKTVARYCRGEENVGAKNLVFPMNILQAKDKQNAYYEKS